MQSTSHSDEDRNRAARRLTLTRGRIDTTSILP